MDTKIPKCSQVSLDYESDMRRLGIASGWPTVPGSRLVPARRADPIIRVLPLVRAAVSPLLVGIIARSGLTGLISNAVAN